jgi:hypothetical protein
LVQKTYKKQCCYWWSYDERLFVQKAYKKKKKDIISSLERQIENEWDVKASFIIIYHKR